MSKITAIKQQRNDRRVNVYLDSDFGFGIDLESFVVLRLKVGQELSEEEIEEIVKKAEFQKTLDKLLRFATLRPRSKKEVTDYFKRKKVHKSLQDKLFNRLKRLELVDDEKFAKWWVEQRQNFKPRSKRILNNELRIKGIEKDLIDKILSEISIDEFTIAKQELEKRAYKWERLDPKSAHKKKMEYLLRKGFVWEVVEKVVKKR